MRRFWYGTHANLFSTADSRLERSSLAQPLSDPSTTSWIMRSNGRVVMALASGVTLYLYGAKNRVGSNPTLIIMFYNFLAWLQ
jgi:hypothetical protein